MQSAQRRNFAAAVTPAMPGTMGTRLIMDQETLKKRPPTGEEAAMSTEAGNRSMAEQARSTMREQGQQAMWEFIRENTAQELNRYDDRSGIAMLSDG